MLRISEICKEKGITQQMLAKKIGITYQSLYSAINGNPKLDTLQCIADALEVDISDLFQSHTKYITCPHCGKKLKIEVE
jgi:DNA-binding XRE family transcriptional regulator